MYKNDEAVSPVIGVILMVAITVILAAIVGVFVLGMMNDVQGPKEVAVTASTNSSATMIIFQGGSGISELNALTVKINGTPAAAADLSINGYAGAIINDTFSTGDVIVLEKTKGALLVVGEFTDGTDAVLLQKTLP